MSGVNSLDICERTVRNLWLWRKILLKTFFNEPISDWKNEHLTFLILINLNLNNHIWPGSTILNDVSFENKINNLFNNCMPSGVAVFSRFILLLFSHFIQSIYWWALKFSGINTTDNTIKKFRVHKFYLLMV